MSSMGRKEGIEEGRAEEPYVTPAAGAEPAGAAVVTPAGWLWRVWGLDDVDAGEVWGRVNSSKTSARRGWCMWMCVAEESLLWFGLVVVRLCSKGGERAMRRYHCGG